MKRLFGLFPVNVCEVCVLHFFNIGLGSNNVCSSFVFSSCVNASESLSFVQSWTLCVHLFHEQTAEPLWLERPYPCLHLQYRVIHKYCPKLIAWILPAVVTMAVLPLHATIAISLPNTLRLNIFILGWDQEIINYLVTSKSLFRAVKQAVLTLAVMALAVGTLHNTTRSLKSKHSMCLARDNSLHLCRDYGDYDLDLVLVLVLVPWSSFVMKSLFYCQ